MPLHESEMDSESELDSGTGCKLSCRRPTWRHMHSVRSSLTENGKTYTPEQLQEMLGTKDLISVNLVVEDTKWYEMEQQYHNMRIFQIDAFRAGLS